MKTPALLSRARLSRARLSRARLPLLLLVLASLACNTLIPPSGTNTPRPGATRPADVETPGPTRTPRVIDATAEVTPEATSIDVPVTQEGAIATVAPEPEILVEGVRPCDYVPGVSVPAVMPDDLAETNAAQLTPPPLDPLPPNTPVDPAQTQLHLEIFDELVSIIESGYIYTDYNGHDLDELAARYRAHIQAGLTDPDYYDTLNLMISELGDDHSLMESPEEAAESDAQFAGNNNFVGIGVLFQPMPEAGRGVIIIPFPGSSAAEAGLRAHDAILAADGQSLFDPDGNLRDIIRGPEGSEVTLTIQRPGEEPFDLTLERRRVTGALPIDYCAVRGTRIGYIFIPNLEDGTLPGQVRDALEELTASGPLDGLILDNRMNHGGIDLVLEGILSLFTEGTVGYFVSRDETRPFEIEAEDVGGSQDVPLVVLVGVATASFGEVMSGVLQNSDGAVVMGETSPGNVETLWGYEFENGARVWLAFETFQPVGLDVAVWEDTGIVPDVEVPTRWDLFTEATDPALAAAVDLLLDR